jgi:prephenate dehydrogenase
MPRERQPPHGRETFQTLAVVGLGLMGGSLALALKRAGYSGRIIGVSRAETIAEAKRLGAIDDGAPYEELASAAERAELIVLASPISIIIEHLRVLSAAKLRAGTVVTDVGSTKRTILEAAKTLPPQAFFIGGHPLCGAETRGIRSADPFLYQNAFYVLTPAAAVPSERVESLGTFLGRTGARVAVVTAADHDRIAATISHLPQLLAVSLVRFLDDLGANREDGIHLAAGGFRDMTRIASSSYSVWRDIIATNRDVIEDVLGRFVQKTAESLRGLDDARLASIFEDAARTRAEIPRDSKGFLTRLWDVLVLVEDKPGMIAGIAAPLAEKGINIKDIEVLKVREGEGGTMRLAFATQEQAREAIRILQENRLTARLRE